MPLMPVSTSPPDRISRSRTSPSRRNAIWPSAAGVADVVAAGEEDTGVDDGDRPAGDPVDRSRITDEVGLGGAASDAPPASKQISNVPIANLNVMGRMLPTADCGRTAAIGGDRAGVGRPKHVATTSGSRPCATPAEVWSAIVWRS